MTGFRPERIYRDEETHGGWDLATGMRKTLTFLRGWDLFFAVEDETDAHALFDAHIAGRCLVDEDGRRARITRLIHVLGDYPRRHYVEVQAYVRAAEQPREEDAPREGGCWRIEP